MDATPWRGSVPGASSKSRALLPSAPAAWSQDGGRSPFKALRGLTVLTVTLSFVLSENFSKVCLSLVSFQSPQMVVLTVLCRVILPLGEKMGQAHMRSRRSVNTHVCLLLEKVLAGTCLFALHRPGHLCVGCWEIPTTETAKMREAVDLLQSQEGVKMSRPYLSQKRWGNMVGTGRGPPQHPWANFPGELWRGVWSCSFTWDWT